MHRDQPQAPERRPAVRAARPARQHVGTTEPTGETAENLALMKRIDEQYLQTPFYGSRKMAMELGVNRKRVQRLMRLMGLEAIYPKRAHDATGRRTQDLSVFTAECRRSRGPTRFGPATSPTFRYGMVFVPDGGNGLVQSLRAGLAIVEHAWREDFAWRRSTRLALATVGRRSSTAIKDRSSRPRRSPTDCRQAAWRSAWTAAGERSTTCSSNGYGGA